MHSLETGIIVSIAAFFFLSFLTFVFLREVNINKEIEIKVESEQNEYLEDASTKYEPELINNAINIINDGGDNDERENDELDGD